MAKQQLTSFSLGKDAQNSVRTYIKTCINRFDFATRRARMTKIDKAMQLESDIRRSLKSKKNERLDYFDDIEVGLISPQVDTVQGFLVDLYLTQQPIFAPVTSHKENTQFAQQISALNFEHARHFKWSRELAIAFRDLAKYNLTAVEATWTTGVASRIANDPSSTSLDGTNVTIEEVAISGNNIKRKDLYNVFYDSSVHPSEVHSDGDHVGTIEQLTAVALIQRLRDYQAGGRLVMNIKYALDHCKAATSETKFFVPTITPEAPTRDPKGYTSLFDGVNGYTAKDSKYKNVNPSQMYEVVTMYARAIPSMLGIPMGSESNNIGIFKFVMVGDAVVMCERITNAHNYFNILLCQVREDGIGEQTKSVAEQVVPLQNLATKLYDFRVASMHRSLGSKVAYLGGVVDEKDVRSNDPSRPIKVTPNPLTKDVRAAITDIPYTDSSQNVIHTEIQQVKVMAAELNRLNRPQQGQFQKGNKTLGEFREVMNNANAELRVMGILVENSLMMPLKTIIKSNIQQYQNAQDLMTITGETIQINPEVLRSALIEFKLADGLVVKEDLVDTNSIKEMLGIIMKDPELRQRYDVVGLITYIMEVQGAKVKQFEREMPAGASQQPQIPQQPQG